MKKLLPNGHQVRGNLATLAFAALTLYTLTSDLNFSIRAKRGQVFVVRSISTPRGGPTIAHVQHHTEEGTIPAVMEVWYWHPKNDEGFPTVYSPGYPDRPVLDLFLRRHALPILSSGCLLAVGLAEAAVRSSRRRSDSLDRYLLTLSGK